VVAHLSPPAISVTWPLQARKSITVRLRPRVVAVFHRPPIRTAKVLRRSAKGTAVQRSVFAPGRKAPALSTGLTDPNGIAFSPDEKFLYVTNWDDKKKVVMRYDAHADGTVSNGRLFFDMTSAPGEEALDGVKVDRQGNLHVSGPGGLWVLSPEGRHLGTIVPPKHPHNFAWGDEDGKTLYLCARSGLYRMRLGIAGIRL
jgi:gluconolactonase